MALAPAAGGVGAQGGVVALLPAAGPVAQHAAVAQPPERPLAEDPLVAVEADDGVVGLAPLLEGEPLVQQRVARVALAGHDDAEAHARFPYRGRRRATAHAVLGLDAALA